jgi:hypothetical protein
VSAPFVIGVDFGTVSARALVVGVERGREVGSSEATPGRDRRASAGRCKARGVPGMTSQIDTFALTPAFGLRWENGICVREDGLEFFSEEHVEVLEIV